MLIIAAFVGGAVLATGAVLWIIAHIDPPLPPW